MMKRFAILASVAGLLVCFQNCSMSDGLHDEFGADHIGSGLSKTCNSILEKTYAETYYPVVRNACLSCHDSGGESGRYFASANFSTAFNSFMSVGRSKLETRLVDSGHKPSWTGAHHQPTIDTHRARWVAAENSAAECMNSGSVATSDKTNAAIFSQLPADGVTWPRVTWDLSTDVRRASLVNSLQLVVSLEVRRYRIGTRDLGYEFRNPRVQVKDDGNSTTPLPAYHLEGLRIIHNGTVLENFTLFGGLNFDARTTVATPMAPGVGYAYALTSVNSTDQFAVQFDRLEHANGQAVTGPPPTNPPITRVTHADLLSGNSSLGIFSARCTSCHNSTTRQGNLNLTDYTAARAAASRIQTRINSASQPMPPTGRLNLTERQVVENWITSGTP